MISLGIWAPIILATIMIFIFYTSGAIIFELFKFKVKNHFVYIAGGFFTYFSFISFLSFPLQLVSVIPYVFFVYYLYTLTIIYMLFCFIFIKYWLTVRFFSINTIIFIIIVFLFTFLNFYFQNQVGSDSFVEHKDVIFSIYESRHAPISFFEARLHDFFGFKTFESWYTLQISMIILTGATSTIEVGTLISLFTLLIESFVFASIFVTLFESFYKERKRYVFWLTLIFSFLSFSTSKIFLIYLGFPYWGGITMMINLILYAIILIIKYTSLDYQEKSKAIFIGMAIGGYFSFSWDSSYHILFFIYCLLFIIQKKYSNNFTKDIFKLSFFSLTGVIFYNIFLHLYIQAIMFLILFLIMVIIFFIMRRNYSIISRFEIFVDNNIKLVTLLIPIIFIIVFIGLILNSGFNYVIPNTIYLNFLFRWFESILSINMQYIVLSIIIISFIVISFVWIFIRNKIPKNFLTTSIDLLIISYLTIYNPLAATIINLFYPTMAESNGIIIVIQSLICINLFVFWSFNKIDAKKPQPIKVIKNYSWFR